MPASFGDAAVTNAVDWKTAAPGAHLPRGSWWELYDDAELNRLETLAADHYRYHENGRKIIGERTRKTYSIGDQVRVRLDRADSVDRKLQFAVGAEERARKKTKRR